MPGCYDEDIDRLETNVKMAGSVSKQIADGMDGDEIIAALFDGIEYDMFDEFDIGYVCPCERDKYLRALVSLNEKDMNELLDAGEPVETKCRFCGRTYVFSVDELREARRLAKEKKESDGEPESGPDESEQTE